MLPSKLTFDFNTIAPFRATPANTGGTARAHRSPLMNAPTTRSTWQDLLSLRGAQADPAGIRSLGDPEGELEAARHGPVLALLDSLSSLQVSGADAETFLQGQLSNDVAALADGEAQYAAYCSAKGRVLCIFVVLRLAAGEYELWLPRSLAESMRKRLGMFVLRSKVTIRGAGTQEGSHGDSDRVRLGVGGPGAAAAIEAVLGAVAPRPLMRSVTDRAAVVALAGDRYVLTVSSLHAQALWDAFTQHARPVGTATWDWLTIAAGVPVVHAAVQDQFVPQMANLDALGAINFRKGCYSGQEIVARMQYLGRLKERLYLAHTPHATPAEGERIFSSVFGDQPCGTVVNAAPAPEGGSDLLAVMQIAAAEAGDLHLGSPEGSALRLRALPYALPAAQLPRPRIA